jgi:hypothetical protein
MIRRNSLLLLLTGILPVLCCAQSPETPLPTNPQAPAAAPVATSANPAVPAEKPKKVWTNEDVKNAGSLSVVGDKRNQQYTMSKDVDAATVAKYRKDLQKLQGQLDDVNKQLKAYTDFMDGKPVTEGGRDVNHGYSRTPVDQQAAKLLDKKKQLTEQMDALYDEARKKGIESGLLK